MTQIVFKCFQTFFENIFFSLKQTAITPTMNTMFAFITITIEQNQSPVAFIDFDDVRTMQLIVHIYAQEFTKATIVFYLKKQSKHFCSNMENMIHAKANAHVTYQFALYQLSNLKKTVIAKPNGNQSTIEIVGKYLMSEKSSLQCDTYQYHEFPSAKSSVIIEGVSPKQSSITHNGFIFIAPQATNTNAKQSSRHVTLTKNTFVHAEPILDVQNNNVSCAHASAIGTVSKEAIFYLSSRGINKQSAMLLVVQSLALFKPINQQDYALHSYAKQLLQSTIPLE